MVMVAGSGVRGGRWRHFVMVLGVMVLAVLCGLNFGVTGAHAADLGLTPIRGSIMPGFGRIIFSFDRLPVVEISQSNGVLVVSFDRPVALDPGHIGFEIPDYISSARLDPDQRAVRFALAKSLRPNLIEAGNELYLDLLPSGWKGPLPTLPADIIQDLSRKARLADMTAKNATVEKGGHLLVDMASSSRISRIMIHGPSAGEVKFVNQPGSVEILIDGQWSCDLARIKSELPRGFLQFDGVAGDGVYRLTIKAVEGGKFEARFEEGGIVVDARNASLGALPASDPVPNIITGATLAEPNVAKNREAVFGSSKTKHEATEPVIIAAERNETGNFLAFSGVDPMPVAAFIRDHRATLVFDTKIDPDIDRHSIETVSAFSNFKSERVGRAFVIGFEVDDGYGPRVHRTDTGYRIDVDKLDRSKPSMPPLTPVPAPNGSMELSVAYSDAGHVVSLFDSVIGDHIIVVPTLNPDNAFPMPLSLPEFSLLESMQGMAVAPIADDLNLRVNGDQIIIGRPDGLALADLSEPSGPSRSIRSVINRAHWDKDKKLNVMDRREELAALIGQSNTDERKKLRLDYGRFLAANGLYREAVASFIGAFDDRRDNIDDPRDRLELGIYEALGFDWRVAQDHLSDLRLTDNEEAILWRGFIASQQGRSAEALDDYRKSGDVVSEYPADLQWKLNSAFAESAIEAGDWALANERVSILERLSYKPKPAYLDYLKARIEEASGGLENARKIYDRLSSDTDRAIEVRAIAARTALDLRTGQMEPAKALTAYENLAIFWRGDVLEAKFLAAAARIALDSKKWHDAFMAVQRLNRLYADTDGIRPLLEEVTLRFDGLIGGDQPDPIAPVEAVALFMEFKEFMPVGRRGDELIRKYIERLVDLDLLPQATDLLRYQIDYRLEGVPRAAAAVRLASLYCIERKPVEAVRAIADTRFGGLPDELKSARRLVEAQARADLGETQAAIELVEGLEGREASLLRGDILWKAKNWAEAGYHYEKALGDVWRDATALSPEDAKIALRASAAYVLSDDHLSVERLGQRYHTLVNSMPAAGIF